MSFDPQEGEYEDHELIRRSDFEIEECYSAICPNCQGYIMVNQRPTGKEIICPNCNIVLTLLDC